MEKHIDFINLMCYGYHSYNLYYPYTGFNSPLFPRKSEGDYMSKLNLVWSANYLFSEGVSKDKIVVGIPTYAQTWYLSDPDAGGPDTEAYGGGDLEYTRVCIILDDERTSLDYDDESRVPFAQFENLWISYDNETSIEEKVNWILDNDFGGVMTFSLNSDDHTFKCSKTNTHVLHSVVYDTINNFFDGRSN